MPAGMNVRGISEEVIDFTRSDIEQETPGNSYHFVFSSNIANIRTEVTPKKRYASVKLQEGGSTPRLKRIRTGEYRLHLNLSLTLISDCMQIHPRIPVPRLCQERCSRKSRHPNSPG